MAENCNERFRHIARRVPLGSLVPLLLTGLVACGTGQVMVIPEDLPELSGSWVPMAGQIPVSANATLLTSFDETVGSTFNLALADFGHMSELAGLIEDALGIDLSSQEAFRRLGLDRHGALGLFLFRDMWLGLVDLVDSGAMKRCLQTMVGRNPDLAMEWRSVQGADVLTVYISRSDTGQPHLHLMVTDEQLIVLYDMASGPMISLADQMLISTRDGDWGQNVLSNPHLSEAIRRFGGDSMTIYFFEPPILLATSPPFQGSDSIPGLFGTAPAPARCRDVETSIGRVIPFGFGSIRRTIPEPGDSAGIREVQQVYLRVADRYQQEAGDLLGGIRINPLLLEHSTAISVILQLDPQNLVAQFGDLADVAGCSGWAAIPGMMGWAADRLVGYPELVDHLTGLVAVVLFDLRSLSRIPYPDLFLMLGTTDPTSIGTLFREAFESELGVSGIAENLGGLRAVQYRVALLYRVTLFEGMTALGFSIGRIPLQWVEEVLTPTQAAADLFFRFTLDGERLGGVLDAVLDVALGDDTDPELREAQQAALEATLGELDEMVGMNLAASYRDGFIQLESTVLREPAPRQ